MTKIAFCRFYYYGKYLSQFYPGNRVWVRDYRKVSTKWTEVQGVKKISDVMSDVKLDFKNLTDQIRSMPVLADIYESNKQHQPESQIKTEKECQSKNERELALPEPKTNLISDTQESPLELPPQRNSQITEWK